MPSGPMYREKNNYQPNKKSEQGFNERNACKPFYSKWPPIDRSQELKDAILYT